MTLGDAARRVRPVDGRMLFAVLVGLFLAVMVEGPACALEFTADLIMHANGKTHASNLEYRRVRMGHVSDFLFQLPVNFQPLEEFDSPDRKERSEPPT